MDLSTIIGTVMGVVLITLAILMGGSPELFFEPSAILIVFGGTVASTLVRFPMPSVKGTLAVVKNAFSNRLPSPEQVIEELVELARRARKEGLLSLENYETEDQFLKLGIQMIVDGSDGEMVEEGLSTDIKYLQRRHRDGQDVLKGIGDAAPSFGMIGTLIGLVIMLANMDDVNSLGPAMAVAILTTLYGALIANVLALPIAKKLEIRSREETLNRELRLVGLINIQKGENPRMMETLLKTFLRNKEEGEERPGPREVKSA